MAKYRDDLQSAQLRLQTLEAKIKEKEAELSERDAALSARDAEIDELRCELERARPHLPSAPVSDDRPAGRGKAILVMLASTAVTLTVAVAFMAWQRSVPMPSPAASATAPQPEASINQRPPSAPPATSAALPSDERVADSTQPLPKVAEPLKKAMRLINIGSYAKAIAMAKAAIEKDPTNADAYMALAWAYESSGKLKLKAEVLDECFRKATKGKYKSMCRSKKR